MQFPESWLREFCNPTLSTQELADTLTMGGFEVEEISPVAAPFHGIVIGEIIEAVQHPDADRLRVCKVAIGQAEPLSIVCGAPNARVGIRVPCATVGAELPPGADGKPFKIKVGKLRGVESYGMLCSAKELGIADDQGGLLELPADAPLGSNIRDYLRLDDSLLTLKLTPNLAHGLSIYGIARELSALTGAPLLPLTTPSVAVNGTQTLAVTVKDKDLCGRFSGRVVSQINTQASTPAWMVEKLARCGQRSVTALVDISNYVMFELGQPSHIFDLDKIHGALEVRWGQAGEKLELLNGNTIEVDAKVGVICDAQQLESLAGIMGGNATAVSDSTCNIYIEAAFWWPEAIQGRARRYSFSTDASHRFERGVDPQGTIAAIERITELVIAICGTDQTAVGPIDDQIIQLPEVKAVDMRVARAAKVIGMPLTTQQCEQAFERLQLAYEKRIDNGADVLRVTAPSYRFDIQIEEDLIEEVARIIGFNSLPDTPPHAPIIARLPAEATRSKFALRHLLADLGYQETINFSFVEESWERDLAGNVNPIRLLNPIAAPMSVMRSSLMGSLLNVLRVNLDRKATRVRLFEVGRVFLRDDSVATTDTTVKGVHQPMHVAGLAYGDVDGRQWSQSESRVDFYDVKGDVEALLAPFTPSFVAAEHPALHPGRSARIMLHGQAIGWIGELHPQWRQQWEITQAPILFELDLAASLERPVPLAKPVPKYQLVERDIAVVVNEAVAFAQVQAAIDKAATSLTIANSMLFDIYRPAPGQNATGVQQGEKSLAIRLTLDGAGATLTDADIDQTIATVLKALESAVSARLRT